MKTKNEKLLFELMQEMFNFNSLKISNLDKTYYFLILDFKDKDNLDEFIDIFYLNHKTETHEGHFHFQNKCFFYFINKENLYKFLIELRDDLLRHLNRTF